MSFFKQVTNFSSNSLGLTSPSPFQHKGVTGTAYTFTEDGTGDGFPPRSCRFDADGVFEYTDWADVTFTLNVKQSEVLAIVPKTVTTNTAIAWLGLR